MYPTREMHVAFLAQIRERKAILQEELQELEAVERYHTTVGLKGATKHETVELILRHLKRSAKTSEILNVLLQCYGSRLKRRPRC